MNDKNVILSCSNELTWKQLAKDKPFSFSKEIIHTGQFIKASDNLMFEVKKDTLEHWAKTWNDMNANGIRVPIVAGHSNASDPKAVLGYVGAMAVIDNKLQMLAEFAGQAECDIALKNDVSIFVPPIKVDGNGIKYQSPIEHIAAVPDPVIPGLDGYVSLKCSNDKTENIPVLKEQKLMDFTKLSEKLKIALNEINFEQEIIKAFEDKDSQVKTLQLSNETKKASPEVVNLKLENYKLRLDTLCKAGKLTPACRDKFIEVCKPEVLSLSLATEGTIKADSFLDILEMNTIISLGEKTGIQGQDVIDPHKNEISELTIPQVLEKKKMREGKK